MAHLIQFDCDCPCGPDPCTTGCDCTFLETDSGTGTFIHTFDVTGQFIIAHDIDITASFTETSGALTARFRVKADGVTIYESDCLEADEISQVVEVPAGTTEIIVELVLCTGSGDIDWDYTVACV